jgi:hypothetical protein
MCPHLHPAQGVWRIGTLPDRAVVSRQQCGLAPAHFEDETTILR